MTTYQKQTLDFLSANSLTLRITLSDSKPAPWEPAGHHYRVTLSRRGQSKRLSFDFWDSLSNLEKGEKPTEYDVLACISSDASCPEDFEQFCAEYGYNADSLKARQTFKQADRFARRLREFFTEQEIEQLSTIR